MKLAFDSYVSQAHCESLAPIILLHGRLYSKKTWAKLAPVIAEKTRRKVYALDTRNHGESPWSDAIDFQEITNDLGEFLEDHKIERAILVGHSMGGRAAITFALQQPDRVEKVIIEDVVCENYSPESKNVTLNILTTLRKSLSAIPDGADETAARKAICDFLRNTLPPTASRKGCVFDEDELPIKRIGNGFAWQANLDALEQMLVNKSNQNLSGTYLGPTVFLYGTHSFFDVENDKSIEKYFPNAVKVRFDGAGHLLHHDHPDRFLKEVVDFILNS